MEVKEIFYSLQGEGEFTGVPMAFIRLSGCNVNCPFCDTDYTGGKSLPVWEIVARVNVYPTQRVIITGGEPLLQNITELAHALQATGKKVHLETNGTLPLPPAALEWITCSPKGPIDELNWNTLNRAHEIKFLCGVQAWEERIYEILSYLQVVPRLYLMPLDSGQADTTQQAIQFVRKHPKFKLCVQLHKYLNIK